MQYFTDKQLKRHKTFLEIAQVFSKRSHSKRSQVGCVIVNEDGRIVSTGYNGTPSGVNNICENSENETHEYVIHAEMNAIFNATTSNLNNSTIYLTLSPCIRCAAALLQKHVKEVIYIEQYRNTEGIEFLKEHGVAVNQIEL